MALPELTADQRKEAQQRANEVRSQRAALLGQLKTGETTVAALLDRTGEPVVGRIRLYQALRAIPGIGAQRADALMETSGVDPNRKLQGLGSRQRDALVAALS